MKNLLLYFGLTFMFFSCQNKNKTVNKDKTEIAKVNIKLDNNVQYTIEYPLHINKDSTTTIKLYDYKSDYDTIVGDRIPSLYLMIEDSPVNGDVFKIKSENKIKYAEYFLPGDGFEVTPEMLKDKKGKMKLSVIILDLYFKDGIKKEDEYLDREIPLQFLDNRSFFDVTVD